MIYNTDVISYRIRTTQSHEGTPYDRFHDNAQWPLTFIMIDKYYSAPYLE